MRANAASYEVTAPATLKEALSLLSTEPCTPLAGGTELMVAFGAGRLAGQRLLSLHRLVELRFVDVTPDAITIGGGSTFTDLRHNAAIAERFPLLAQAASWIGSIANQNRATLGGNLVNASPAADAPPALLVYEAELTLVSAEGMRTLPYGEFHLGYKITAMQPQELLFSIRLMGNYHGYKTYLRKVGTRNAQAISKVALAGLARVEGGALAEIRLAAASLREVPTRLVAVEQALLGKAIGAVGVSAQAAAAAAARGALRESVLPIDDIRSTAAYRLAVAGNLIEAFLLEIARSPG